MIIRILADREPYSAFASSDTGLASGMDSLLILNGPAPLDLPPPDLLVLPAEDFLCLPVAPRGREMLRYMPYGPVSLMERSFERGCVDYLREPWSLPELRARASRLQGLHFQCGEKSYELRGARLGSMGAWVDLSEGEAVLLQLLACSAPLPVPRAAAQAALLERNVPPPRLGPCISTLRGKMERLEAGFGARLLLVRGLGYRLEGISCG